MATGIGGFGPVTFCGAGTGVPQKENNYFVSFEDWGATTRATPLWSNLLAQNMHLFPPCVPDDSQLLKTFKKALSDENKSDENKPIFCWDFFTPHLVLLELPDLMQLSQLSKHCFM